MIPDDLFYTEYHVWVRPEEEWVEIGATAPILRKLEPLIGVEILDADDAMKFEIPFAELEGAEQTHYLYPPVETRIVEVNEEVLWDQTKLVEDPYESGWLLRAVAPETEELLHLMTATAYAEFCEEKLGEDREDE